MIVRVVLSDKSFVIQEILDQEFMDLTWEFNRIGGCGSINFELPRQFCNERALGGDFNLKVYTRNPTTKDYDLAYQGLIETKTPTVRGIEETVAIQGHGYQTQLSRIQLIGLHFAAQEASVIVKYVLDNYIVPNTNITYDIGDIQATSFTFDSIDANTDAQSFLQTIADTVGGIEHGVDKNRKYYFKARSSAVGLRFALGDNVTAFTDDDSFKDIVNRVIVQGGDIAGVPFSPDPTGTPYNNISSQLKYGRRDQIYQNSAILTNAVAEQLAQSILTEKSDVVRRARCEISNYETLIESTLPIPLFNLIVRGTLYGEKLYGTFLYAGKINFQVNRIVYKLASQDSALVTSLELGQPRPNIAETIGQLKYNIEQLRGAGL